MRIRQLLCIGPKYYYEAVCVNHIPVRFSLLQYSSLDNPLPTKLWILNRETAYRVAIELLQSGIVYVCRVISYEMDVYYQILISVVSRYNSDVPTMVNNHDKIVLPICYICSDISRVLKVL